ncbi:hypothetical protein SteCoe_23807 [Stentor coeruleus]|uniref:RING-type domain-containing protein n=1 Tax=Stentor coeruleus TaxID=5963 RepID=A0A1R2BIZ9_9CILI|nr:hypothetical protein SteCoe_23807 [Stentor coeruleus]
MFTCKKKCLISNCTNKCEYYVNYSRFHKVCQAHLIKQNSFIKCEVCNNTIECYSNLDNPNITEYKKIISSIQNFIHNTQTSEPEPEIKSNSTEQLTKPNHQSQNFINNTNKGTTIKACFFINCKSKKTKAVCSEHSFCERHFPNKQNFCPSCKCSKCKKNSACFLYPCGSLCQEKCNNFRTCCYLCCSRDKSKKIEGCNHYLCKEHYIEDFLCYCIKCCICNKGLVRKKNVDTLLCDECSQKTCPQCKELAISLFKDKCNHNRCDKCINEPCYFCTNDNNTIKNALCVNCKASPSTDKTCSKHPKCEDCEHIFAGVQCIFCQNPEDFKCSSCKNYYPFVLSWKCTHKLCSMCIENQEYCPLCPKIINCTQCLNAQATDFSCELHPKCINCILLFDSCIICYEFKDTYKCDLCNIYSPDVKELVCKHKMCLKCQKNPHPLCVRHSFCAYCAKVYKDCPSCLKCSYCGIFVKEEGIYGDKVSCGFCIEKHMPGRFKVTQGGNVLDMKNHRASCSFCKECGLDDDIVGGKCYNVTRNSANGNEYVYGDLFLCDYPMKRSRKTICFACKNSFKGDYECSNHPLCQTCKRSKNEIGCYFCNNDEDKK